MAPLSFGEETNRFDIKSLEIYTKFESEIKHLKIVNDQIARREKAISQKRIQGVIRRGVV